MTGCFKFLNRWTSAPAKNAEKPKPQPENQPRQKTELEIFVSPRFNMIDVYVRQKDRSSVIQSCRYEFHYRNPLVEVAWKDCQRQDINNVPGASGRFCTLTDLQPMTTYDIRAELISQADGSTVAESKQVTATTSNPAVPIKCYIATYAFTKRVDHELSTKIGDILEEDPTHKKTYEDFAYVKNLTTQDKGFVPLVTVSRYPAGDQPKVLIEQDCFFNANRRKAMVWMMRPNVETGRFIIRPASDNSFMAMSIRFGINSDGIPVVEHYKIYLMPDGYGCYVNVPTRTFEDIGKLISYYQRHSISADRTILLTAPFPRNPIPPKLDEIKIPAEKLHFLEKLGEGNFGEVFKAKLDRLDVAVKKLLPPKGASSSGLPRASVVTNSEALLQEAEAMASLFHDNLVRLIGVCVDSEPYMIVSEIMNRGSLLKFLNDDAAVVDLQLQEVVFILSQVACGMAYLEEKNVVHRDLRAANVLVHDENDKLEIKITDFGLTRILSENEKIYEGGPDALVPIRWTAPEAATASHFSVKSDVWSFGILAVEVMTLGAMPYKGKPNGEIFKFISSGGRITANDVRANRRKVIAKAATPIPKKSPLNTAATADDVDGLCPETLFYEITLCWKADPQDRPTFAALYDFLDNYESGSNYMN